MASSKDFEKIWESYQEVVKAKDVSIVDYCQRNRILNLMAKRGWMLTQILTGMKRKSKGKKVKMMALTQNNGAIFARIKEKCVILQP